MGYVKTVGWDFLRLLFELVWSHVLSLPVQVAIVKLVRMKTFSSGVVRRELRFNCSIGVM